MLTLTNHKRNEKNNDQSELVANTSNWRQARENTCEQVTIGFGFYFLLVEKVARVALTNHTAW